MTRAWLPGRADLYHHSTIVVVWGWVHGTWPDAAHGGTATYMYGAWVNSVVHVVMYAYYGLTAVGVRPPARFKKAVTAVQLTQFASCIAQAVLALAVDTTPLIYNEIQVAYHIMMLKLFLPLLLGTAHKKSRAPRANDAAAAELKQE